MQASAAAAAAAAAKAAAAECGTVILQPPSISPALPLTAATPPSFTGQDISPISSTPLQPSLHNTVFHATPLSSFTGLQHASLSSLAGIIQFGVQNPDLRSISLNIYLKQGCVAESRDQFLFQRLM